MTLDLWAVYYVIDIIQARLRESLAVKERLLAETEFAPKVASVVSECVRCFKMGSKVLFCGNGGSASDAQHLAAELSGRYYLDRKALCAEALHVNSSYLTAVANDYSYDVVFARLIEGIGRPGDILFALSTSGNSSNITRAVKMANSLDMKTVALTGAGASQLSCESDICFQIPSKDTPRIQEAHIMTGHIICELIEREIFGDLA